MTSAINLAFPPIIIVVTTAEERTMLQGNLDSEYTPARIHKETVSNNGHVRVPRFSDRDLGKPTLPVEPKLTEVEHWARALILWAIPFVLAIVLSSFKLPVFLPGLVVLWLWVSFSK